MTSPHEVGWAIERLRELRRELCDTESHLREIDRVRAEAVETLLRLSGAIQVLEELVAMSPVFGQQPGQVPATIDG